MHGIFKEVGKIDANLNNFKKECFIKICKAKEKRKNKNDHKHSDILTNVFITEVLFSNSEMTFGLS